MSYMQVYNDKIQDLLGNPSESLKLCETAGGAITYKPPLNAIDCENAKDIFALLEEAKKLKSVDATQINEQSSRAHTILRLTICPRNQCITARGGIASDESSFTFVDLAGSERAGRMKLTGSLLEEAKAINKSLSALGNVISALARDSSASGNGHNDEKHVPWRTSKLTRMLSESLNGRCQTALVVCVSPSLETEEKAYETLTALQFGERAKNVHINSRKLREEDFRVLQEELQGALDEAQDKERDARLRCEEALEELEALRLAEAAQRDAKDAALARAEKLERESSSRAVEGPGAGR